MSDLFGIGIPEEWTTTVMNLIRLHEENRYYLLTKQPQNLAKFSPFPDNCYVGVTATDSIMFAAAYYHLMSIKAAIKYISIEPLLHWDKRAGAAMIYQARQAGVGWIIAGSQTKPYRPPAIEDVESIVEACDKAGVAVFLKKNLDVVIPWNGIFRVKYAGALRQEMPGA